jgi:hypothetical protein
MINGGVADGKKPISRGKTRFEKYASAIILIPVARAMRI